MATQIVMDHTGDRQHQFDPQNASELAEAEKRFKELTGAEFTAAARTTAGEAIKIASFDPSAKETVFFPGLVAG
jgi:protein-disulfide isomerase-like protein with CxxC motif